MGLDKLRLVAHLGPQDSFLEELNNDLTLPREFRAFSVQFRNTEEYRVKPTTRCSITPGRGRSPFFFLQMNCSIPSKGNVHVFELNPNNLDGGFAEFQEVHTRVFGEVIEDPAISRIDLNADIEIPVHYLRHSLRVPRKRKTSEYAKSETTQLATFNNRGVTGFCIGRSPSLLRVYDKREEMLHLREDVTGIPRVLTRLEWELRHARCPVRLLSQLQAISTIRPFDLLEVYESPEVYDFHNYPLESTRRFTLNRLSAELGNHDAIRVLNAHRNFARDYRPLAFEISGVKERLQESYAEGVRRFFANQRSDVRSMLSRQLEAEE